MPEAEPVASPPSPTCEVCEAPALPVDGVCAFCGSPLHHRGDPNGLLDYVHRRLPAVALTRSGLLRRGPAQRAEFSIGGTAFKAQIRKETLELTPPGSPEEWAGVVVRTLAELAPDDRQQRAILSKTGWAWR